MKATSKWIHCPMCDHRLFFVRGGAFHLEIKCSSCKRVLEVNCDEESPVTYRIVRDNTKRSYGGRYEMGNL